MSFFLRLPRPPCPPSSPPLVPSPRALPLEPRPLRPGTPRAGGGGASLPSPFGAWPGRDGGTTIRESRLGSSVLAHVFPARRGRSNTCATPAPLAAAAPPPAAPPPPQVSPRASQSPKANTNVQSLTSAWTHVHTHVGSICGIVQVSTPTHPAAHLPRPPEFTAM